MHFETIMLIQIYDFVVLIENIKEKNLDFEVCLLSQFNGRIILVIDLVKWRIPNVCQVLAL